MYDTKIASIAAIARAINKFVRTDIDKDASAIRDLIVPLDPVSVEHQRVIRVDDLFVADFFFHNLSFSPGSSTRLIRRNAARDAYISMELQGQHFGEEVLIIGDIPIQPPSDVSGELRNKPPPHPHWGTLSSLLHSQGQTLLDPSSTR